MAVRGGFDSENEILGSLAELVESELGESDESVISDLESAAQRMWQEQRAREAKWAEPAVNDAIDQTFTELNKRGIVALQNAGYTMSDGWSDVNDIASDLPEPPRGGVFYHGQDLERGVRGEGLCLAFGAYEDDDGKHEQASAAIAREVCDVLAQHGVTAEWDGQVSQRIEIPPFEWRRRYRAQDQG